MTIAQASSAGGPHANAAGGAVVLIIDDEPDNRDLLRRYLDQEGLRSVMATNGAEAIAAYCRNAPKLVLLDLVMPSVDGFEFLRWLRKEPEADRAPAIVLTASRE